MTFTRGFYILIFGTNKRLGILVAIGGVILISLILWGLGIYTEVLWFKELNYASVFWRMFG